MQTPRPSIGKLRYVTAKVCVNTCASAPATFDLSTVDIQGWEDRKPLIAPRKTLKPNTGITHVLYFCTKKLSHLSHVSV